MLLEQKVEEKENIQDADGVNIKGRGQCNAQWQPGRDRR